MTRPSSPQGALASLPINAATIFLGLTYTLLAQRRESPHQLWRGGRGVDRHRRDRRRVALVAVGRLLINVVAFAICTPLMQRYRQPKCRRSRAAGTTCRCAPRWSRPRRRRRHAVGPRRSEHQRHPRAVPGGVLQHDPDPASAHRRPRHRRRARQQRLGPDGIRHAIAVLHLGALHLGSPRPELGLATCICWNLMLWGSGEEGRQSSKEASRVGKAERAHQHNDAPCRARQSATSARFAHPADELHPFGNSPFNA